MNRAIFLFVVLSVFGCAPAEGGDEATPVSGAPEKDAAVQRNVPLPDDFPSDLFLPESLHIQAVYDAGSGYQLNGRIEGAKAAVRDQMTAGMVELGWEAQPDDALAQLQSATKFKKQERYASVALFDKDSGVLVRIDVSK